jgi:hypothetical protein
MTAPVGQRRAEQFKPPAWILSKAQENVKLAGVNSEALARRLQETREQAIANSAEHQKNMRALGIKMEELRAKQDLDPFKSVEQADVGGTGHRFTPKVITRGTAEKRKAQVQTPGERQTKMEKVRTHEMKETKGKQTMPSKVKKASGSKDKPTSAVCAESSTAGATREAAAADKPESMDIDYQDTSNIFVKEKEPDKHQYPTLPPPAWQTAISLANPKIKEYSRRRPPALTSLEALKDTIRLCEATRRPAELAKLYDDLRNHVHKAEFLYRDGLDKFMIRKANILTPSNGLPRIFAASANFPPDLKDDAYNLYLRWYAEEFEQDIFRGIKTVTKDRNSDSIDKDYHNLHPGDAKYYGAGDLVLGQWWPTQLCTVRDGAHGAAQGGIFGEKGKGAYSIVLSGGGYHDYDAGDSIEYSGTEGKNFTPTENTLHLVKSSETGNPVRVIRSSQLNKRNTYRPELGLRYDGLYTVVGYTITDPEKQTHRFRLVRCEGQDPIRYEGKAKRPTIYEIAAFDELRAKWPNC